MKVAIVHDWLTGMRGGENCLEVFCKLYPDADLFTLLHLPGKLSPLIESRTIHTSFLQSLPSIETRYRQYLPLMPWAIRSLDLTGHDLILSSSHCVAKGVRVPRGSLHISYCYTPMRYIWDQYDEYFNVHTSGVLTAAAMKLIAPPLRRWDVRSSRGVDNFIAISNHVQKRIKTYYNRESDVIHCPVDSTFYSPSGEEPGDFFLVVSAFAPYKRVDLAVEAFNRLGYPLVVVGDGQMAKELKKIAGPNVQFKGWKVGDELRSYYARCRAFIFCGEEDFGITPLEAQAMGRPVIALARGGALETVIPDRETWKPENGIPEEQTARPTGVFFYQQSPEALASAVRHFEAIEQRFQPETNRNNALQFDTQLFSDRIQHYIEERFQKHRC